MRERPESNFSVRKVPPGLVRWGGVEETGMLAQESEEVVQAGAGAVGVGRRAWHGTSRNEVSRT